MPKLIFELEIQGYDDDDEAILGTIRDALVSVVALCDLSVGTFAVSRIES